MSLTTLLHSRYKELELSLPGLQQGQAIAADFFDQAISYLELLARWTKTVDLVAPAPLDVLTERHLVDSMAAGMLISRFAPLPQDTVYLDVGSGAGLPGIILALMEPQRKIVLCEPREKRVLFLKEAKRVLKLGCVDILRERMEAIDSGSIPGLGLITARAVGQDAIFLREAARLLPIGGKIVQLAGPNHRIVPCPDSLKLLHEVDYNLGIAGTPRKLLVWNVSRET